MQWQLIFRKVSVEGDIKEKVLKKLSPLSKYLGKVGKSSQKGVVKLSKGDRWGYKVQMVMKLPGREMMVTGKGKELLSALDEAYAKSARIIRKYYERLRKKRRRRK